MSTPGESTTVPRRSWTRADQIALPIVTVAAFVVRVVRLGSPAKKIFDEVFYAPDACWYFVHRASVCGIAGERNLEHPPLGKDLIGLGIKAFGYNAFGWRIAAAVFGTVAVGLTYLLARKLLGSTAAAVFASGLVTIDFLAFAVSRIAMLDIFVLVFTLAAFLFVMYDHDEILRGQRSRWRWWRIAAGIAGAGAIATKWSGVFALIGVAILSLAWEMHGTPRRIRALVDAVRREGVSLGIAFVLIPAFLYCAAYIGHIHGDLLAAPWREGAWFHELYQRQLAVYEYHLSLTKVNPLQSPPWAWLLLKRSFPFFRVITDSGQHLTVQAGGSPVTWWLAIPAILWITVEWFRHNSPERPEGVIVAGFWVHFLPWTAFTAAPFLLGSGRSGMFIYYALPMVPFMALAQASAAQRLWRWIAGRVAVAAFVLASVAAFVFYYPFLTALPLSERAWRARVWIFDDCRRPDRSPLVVVDEKRVHGQLTTVITSLGRRFYAPLGWCWIENGPYNLRVGLRDLLNGDGGITP